ncbi:MAG: hypothetical protein J1E95_11710, partial [Muribaculaceae bacterium]|nr:hypothetical protein [Muribaculaceae bacterium]
GLPYIYLHSVEHGIKTEKNSKFLEMIPKTGIRSNELVRKIQDLKGYRCVRSARRPIEDMLKAGQIDGSILGLSKEWEIGRKATSRLLEDFSNLGMIKVESNPLTSIITMMCVYQWMDKGIKTTNPFYSTTLNNYQGARIHLYNGQQFGMLRKSSPRRKATHKEERAQSQNVDSELPVENKDGTGLTQTADPSSEIEVENMPRQLPFIPEINNESEYGAAEDKD